MALTSNENLMTNFPQTRKLAQRAGKTKIKSLALLFSILMCIIWEQFQRVARCDRLARHPVGLCAECSAVKCGGENSHNRGEWEVKRVWQFTRRPMKGGSAKPFVTDNLTYGIYRSAHLDLRSDGIHPAIWMLDNVLAEIEFENGSRKWPSSIRMAAAYALYTYCSYLISLGLCSLHKDEEGQ